MPISKIHRDGDKFSSWWIFYYIVTEINFHHDEKNVHPPTLFTRPRYQSHDNRVSANLYLGVAIIVPRSCFYSNFPANEKLALHISNRSHKKRLFKYIYTEKFYNPQTQHFPTIVQKYFQTFFIFKFLCIFAW
jgi:hypothetical protein